jgi:hypothetical protein
MFSRKIAVRCTTAGSRVLVGASDVVVAHLEKLYSTLEYTLQFCRYVECVRRLQTLSKSA